MFSRPCIRGVEPQQLAYLRGKYFMELPGGSTCLAQGAMLFAETDELLVHALLMELAAAADEGVKEASSGAVGEDALVEAVHEVAEDLIEIGLLGLPDRAVETAPEGGVPGAGERGLRIGLGRGGAEGPLFHSLGGVVAAKGALAAGGAAAGASVGKDIGAAKHKNLFKAGQR
jgi:hypothetical protein